MEKCAVAVGFACLLVAGVARAYDPECRELAQHFAVDPGTLKLGELDVLKTCLSELQRRIVAGEPMPESGQPPACPEPPPPIVAECPPCPPAKACPRAERVPEDPVRQRYIPRY